MKQYCIFLIILSIILSGLITASVTPSSISSIKLAKASVRHVLIINSYHEGYHWTDRIMKGIKSILNKEKNLELFITYMDTKRCSDEDYFILLKALYAHKYQHIRFDAIISSDDHALNFLLKYRDKLFSDIPVFFCGINKFSPSRLRGKTNFTGVYESYDVAGTIQLMLKLHPGTRNITTIVDNTYSGKDFRKYVEQAENKFSANLKFDYFNNLELNELEKRLGMLSRDTLVLWAVYLRTPGGHSISSEESLKMITNASNRPTYCIWDVVGQGVVGGKITSPNHQGRKVAELALKFLGGTGLNDIPVTGSPMVYSFDYNVLKHFKIELNRLPKGSIIINRPYSIYREYKKIIWLIIVFVVFLLTAIIILIYFIWKSKRTQEELRESEKRFQDLSENSSDWIWEFDENEIFTYSSSSVTNMLGYTPDEIVGTSAFTPMSSVKTERVLSEFYKFKKKRKPFSAIINSNNHKDGTKRILESSGVPIIDKGGAYLGYRGIDRDITDRMSLESKLRQAQKMEAIGTLAGGIAHDFNNILGVIMGYADLTMDKSEDSKVVLNNLKHIMSASVRAKDMVNQILAFSRKDDSTMSPINIVELIKEVITFLRSSIPTTIEIKSNVETNLELTYGNTTQINQILMNLCTNAAHAMSEKGGVLGISLNSVVLEKDESLIIDIEPGKYQQLTVSDTGFGMTKDIIGRIFEPYFTTKQVDEGTGMGLAVIYGILKSHGGSIKVESEPGKGSTFYVYVPVLESDKPEALQEDQHSLLFGNNENILFVDDEKALVEIGAKMLRNLKYRVESRTNSLDALEVFKMNPDKFDLIVTDMTMPSMTGVQLAGEIRKTKPDIPIIICTGFSNSINRDNYKTQGINALVMKPMVIRELAETIRGVLDKKQ